MKRLTFALTILLLSASLAAQQPAVSIRNGTADPATCKPGSTNIFYRSDTAALKVCSALNTWTALGGGGGSGTVTSIGLIGTANQITVTGASPITTSGSWTLSFPAGGVTLPGTTAGTFSGGLTGNVTGNVSGSSGSATGNAATATILQTARAINGVNFDGSAPITVTAAGSTLSDTVTVTKGGTGQTTYTKGDLLAAPGGASLNKLAVGSDAQVLTADSASTNGVKWATAAGGVTNSAGSNIIPKSDGTNLVASGITNTSGGDLTTGAGVSFSATATAPASASASQAGVSSTIVASNAVDGSSTHAAATGGDVVLTSGTAVNGGSGGRVLITRAGTLTRPALYFAGCSNACGAFVSSDGNLDFAINGNHLLELNPNGPVLPSAINIIWTSNATPLVSDRDTGISRSTAGIVCANTASNGNCLGTFKGAALQTAAANGEIRQLSNDMELLTLSTGGVTTSTASNRIPASAQIDAVLYRITTTITTATAFTVSVTGGNPLCTLGTAVSAQTTLTSGTTGVLVPCVFGDVYNATAATLTVTTTGTPGAGVIRLSPIFTKFTPPSS